MFDMPFIVETLLDIKKLHALSVPSKKRAQKKAPLHNLHCSPPPSKKNSARN